MAKKQGMDSTTLKAIFDAEVRDAMGEFSGELAQQRSTAMDRYLGEPLGTEMEGRSKVQTRDVMDTIEWILPSLIRIFTNSDSAVQIEPVGPEDEQASEQETDYLNYIFYKKNQGFLILYTWFKDALLQKVGIVKNWPEKVTKETKEVYEGLSDYELAALMADDDYEIMEHQEAYSDQFGTLHTVKVLKTCDETQIKVDNLPPEEFLISRDARSIFPKLARFTAHKTTKTISELKEMGYSDTDIRSMEWGMSDSTNTLEDLSRKNLADEQTWSESDIVNESMQQVKIVEGYLKVDVNDDGIAELVKVFRSGDFIDWEEVDHNPFNALTPIILTHKFYGLSVADILTDLQEIRSELWRAYMNNTYQSINGTVYYNQNTVNVEDLLSSSPWGIRAVNGSPGTEVMHVPPSGLSPEVFQLFELTEGIKRDRIGDFQNQLDPDVLAKANTGVVVSMMEEAKAKIEMIARIFAETGVKDLFRDLHKLAREHSDKEDIVKLRNSWVPVNPQSWSERTDFTVRVGLGTRSKQERVANLSQIVQMQGQLAPLGVVNPGNVFAAVKDLTEAMGFKTPELYWQDPAQVPPQPPQPDPNMMLIQLQAEVEQAKIQLEREKLAVTDKNKQIDVDLKAREMELAHENNQAKVQVEQLKLEIAALKNSTDSRSGEMSSAMKSQADSMQMRLKELELVLDQRQSEQQLALDRYKADLDAQVKLTQKATVEEKPKKDTVGPLVASLVDEMRALRDELNKPKDIKRDSNGKIIQVGNRKVKRGDDGKIAGLE